MITVNGYTLRSAGPSQKVAFTTVAGCSAAIPQSAQSVTCYLSTAGYLKVGYGPTSIAATATDIPVPANTLITIPVPQRGPNDAAGSDKIFVSAIRDASDGNLFVQPNAD